MSDRVQEDHFPFLAGGNHAVADAGDSRLQQIAGFFGRLFATLKILDQVLTMLGSPANRDGGEDQQHEDSRAANRAEEARLIGGGADLLPLPCQQIIAGGLDLSTDGANLIHIGFAAIVADDGESRIEPLAAAEFDRLREFIHLGPHQRFQFVDALGCRGWRRLASMRASASRLAGMAVTACR